MSSGWKCLLQAVRRWRACSVQTAAVAHRLVAMQQVNPLLALLNRTELRRLARGSRCLDMLDGDNIFLPCARAVHYGRGETVSAGPKLATQPGAAGGRRSRAPIVQERLCILLEGICNASVHVDDGANGQASQRQQRLAAGDTCGGLRQVPTYP